ncbi:MAG: argininosuccinate lyase [Desulfatiglans sp.]|nr:argininosuccinate lyase [Thermodesulfobacteriota bacterium]MEE4352089.1 argininosuccinate lyase [Desulfatiglans sp.]
MTQKIWGGRFREETHALVNRFNASISFDRLLYAHDIEGSIAHCRMLAKQEIISDKEASRIVKGLKELKSDLDQGKISVDEDCEDIHSFVESALFQRIGEAAKRLHTGRSRNDQVALDMRMYTRDAIHRMMGLIRRTQVALVNAAEENIDLIMPGYTHLQRAQPVLLAHHLLAYYEMLKRDRERMEQSLKRVNVLPLGSAALAGSTFDLDRDMVARELGFEAVSANSMDAVSDRDFVLEFLFNLSVLMMHLSRLSEELVIWSSQEFGFITISDSFCTGSSIMPQKKNPDMPELIRGKTGRVYGHLMSLLTTMKGLPLSYNKDMQEDKEALFDATDTALICLDVMSLLLGAISFNAEKLDAAARKGFLTATDLADYLVGKGVTFREAHKAVGELVLAAADQGKELHLLSLSEMKPFSNEIEEDVYDWLDPIRCLERRNIFGGTGPDMVKKSLEKAKTELAI